MTSAEQRVAAARRALDAARVAREANHNPETALLVARAELAFIDARRALVREDRF
ncbi:hypothetical protein [Methylobacterium organophilum]|uniref:Uncharacterized protein n=1 Tax=Methylobacterium organophilum TaxID=410 RepID=A0ABQ4THI3_METOR|nr:hypothetical protein [Methylobacterium organophilum]GJE29792.1 hypothetical protein LKMONMHP_4678 [Methylobacterium organophilum]